MSSEHESDSPLTGATKAGVRIEIPTWSTLVEEKEHCLGQQDDIKVSMSLSPLCFQHF